MKFLRISSVENIKPISPLIIVLIWGLFILPSCFSPQWSYLDDPTTLIVSKELAADPHIPAPDGQTGRYFPAYWIYHAVLFSLFGFHLTGYYVVQALMFLLTLFLIHSLVAEITRSRLAGLFTVFLVATASPVAENLYTLSKAEPKALVYLLCAVYLFMLLERRTDRGIARGITSWISIILLMLFAMLTKETAVVFSVFAVAGAVLAVILRKKGDGIDKYDAKSYLFLFMGSIGSILLARGLYYLKRPPVSTDTYVSYPINLDLVLSNLKMYASQQPDVLFLGLLAVLLAVISYKRRDEGDIRSFIFACALFFTGTAYLGGLLIWRWSLGYYLLIPASFFSIAVVILVIPLARSLVYKYRKICYISVAFLLLSRLYSIPYFSFIAHAQKTQDKIYTEAMGAYMQVAGPGERLLVEEWPFFVEPVAQSNTLLKIFGKQHLTVAGVRDIITDMEISADTLKLYQVPGSPDRESRHPRKNDYILTLTGNRQSPWVLRGISPFLNERGSSYKMKGLELELVKKTDVRWYGLGIAPPVGLRTYSAGYRLYKVLDPVPAVTWEGRWADGWIGDSARCSLRVTEQRKEFIFRGFVTEHTIPSLLTVIQDKKEIKKVPLDKAGPFSFAVGIAPPAHDGKNILLRFTAEKTFNPKDLGHSNDNRNLSVRLSVRDIEVTDF